MTELTQAQEAEQLAARAMTRLNKLRAIGTTQQRYLTEARDYLTEALDALQAEHLRLEDREIDGEVEEAARAVVDAARIYALGQPMSQYPAVREAIDRLQDALNES